MRDMNDSDGDLREAAKQLAGRATEPPKPAAQWLGLLADHMSISRRIDEFGQRRDLSHNDAAAFSRLRADYGQVRAQFREITKAYLEHARMPAHYRIAAERWLAGR
jgi:ferric-dicitrate binding protein FerR (iron transport regulator)